MREIRVYRPEKYGTERYEEVSKDVYRRYDREEDRRLNLVQVEDRAILSLLKRQEGWELSKRPEEKGYESLHYDGMKYYRDADTAEPWYYERNREEEEPAYVTAIVFVPEPELGENDPASAALSPEPMEELLDEFCLRRADRLEEENRRDPEHSYLEVAAGDADAIRDLLTIVGKHVFLRQGETGTELAMEEE